MNETQNNRRDFLKETGKRALWVAPTVTVLMTASSQPAKATGTAYGNFTGTASGTGDDD